MFLGDFFLLPYEDASGNWWYISPLSGSLIKSPTKPKSRELPKKVLHALDACSNPYECIWTPNKANFKLKEENLRLPIKFDRLFFFLGNKNFLLSVIFSLINRPLVKNSLEAFSLISELPNYKDTIADKCLQRSLLAAKISGSFPSRGVIFIGAEISSGEMHAWIMESNLQPDFEDRSWINYRPLLAITKI
jgi:hypothetical protein